MENTNETFTLEVEKTTAICPVGEKVGTRNMVEGKIPVYSYEGACIRGDIARIAANMVAKEEPYRRGCHGELFTVPHSAITKWTQEAEKVIVIDGCYLRCHGRLMKNLLGEGKLIEFDALKFHKKYSDVFDMDAIPENEKKETAREVADMVLRSMGIEGSVVTGPDETEKIQSAPNCCG